MSKPVDEHYGIMPDTHKDYRCWVYNRIDGEMLSKIVDAQTAVKLFEDGWRMTPAEFTEDDDLKGNPSFEALADDMAQIMNFLINIEKCDDLLALREFATGFLGMKVRSNTKLATLRKRMVEEATKKGLYE